MLKTTPQAQALGARSCHPSQHQPHTHPINSPLYVVTAISNPQRFRTRYELYRAFEKRCEDAGAILYTVELALRDRHFEVTSPDNPRHVQLRSPAELWHKENLLNIGIQRLPSDWEYVAWIDADVDFARPDWANETLHQLQHYHVVQMWSHAQDLGPAYEPVGQCFESFLSSIALGRELPPYLQEGDGGRYDGQTCGGSGGYGGFGKGGSHLWHSGYAWAARRNALADVGGLGDIAVLGSSDHHMAAALIGKVDHTIHPKMCESYRRYWRIWQQRAIDSIKGNVGFVPGLLLHYWHGAKRNRRYVDRWQILTNSGFDPDLDLKRDVQGLLALTDRNPKLRDGIRAYFRQRNEDSIDL